MEKPFRDREDVKAEIRRCDLVGSIITYACLLFAALGVITNALDITLGLDSMSWFLLAVVAGLNAIIPHMHALAAKHLFGIESE